MFAFLGILIATIFGIALLPAVASMALGMLGGDAIGGMFRSRKDTGQNATGKPARLNSGLRAVLGAIGGLAGLAGGYYFFLLKPCLDSGFCSA